MSTDESTAIRFQCPHCQIGLKAQAVESGARRKCPKCEREFVIPGTRKKTAGSRPRANSRQETSLIPVVCSVCQTRMYATSEQVGQFIECPDCFTPSAVKPPREKPKISAVMSGSDFSYEMQAAHELNSSRIDAHDLLTEADRQLERDIDEEPEPLARPFMTGVFTFPYYLRNIPVTVGMALSLTMALGLVKVARDLQGNAVLAAPIVSAAAAVVMMLVFLPVLVCWLKILENTVQGEDEADYHPDGGLFAVLDWVGETFYLIVAVCLSAMPAFLVADFASLPTDQLAWRLAPSLAASLLFPLVLLSMLEANSPLMPFSKPIWSSLFSLPGTWCLFYLLATALVGCAGACADAVWMLTARDWTPAVIALTIALILAFVNFSTIYFRLLGRLGWVLTQRVTVNVDEGPGGNTEDLLEPSRTSIV